MNTAFKSLYVEYSSVSYSLRRDSHVLLNNSLHLSTRNLSGFRPSAKIVLKPLVIVNPDLFFNGIAHAYFVNISITVKINLQLLLYLLRDYLSIKSADHVSSLYNGITPSLLNFVI